jgi:cellulose synthase/poly-beta-1,6-N-acetylglucosamine synthase-like glycosyltransferase
VSLLLAVAGIAVVAILALADFQNLLARILAPLPTRGASTHDFTIVVPIFGRPQYLKNLRFLRRYRAQTLIAVNVTNERMRRFAERLGAIGWRVAIVEVGTPCSAAQVLSAALDHIESKYTIRLDGDSFTPDDFCTVVQQVERSGLDLCSVKIHVDKPQTVAQHLQAVEYRIAMLARHYRPWATSGACFIARTDALRQIMASHSQWFFGEDIETGIVAHRYRMRIGHSDAVVYTEAPATFRALFRQRRGWWAGQFRQWVVNFDHMIWFPIAFLYNTVLLFVLVATRWQSMSIAGFGLLAVLWTGLTVAVNWQVRSPWMLCYVPYAVVQSLVMPAAGAIYYVQRVRQSGRVGRFLIPHRRLDWRPKPKRPGLWIPVLKLRITRDGGGFSVTMPRNRHSRQAVSPYHGSLTLGVIRGLVRRWHRGRWGRAEWRRRAAVLRRG